MTYLEVSRLKKYLSQDKNGVERSNSELFVISLGAMFFRHVIAKPYTLSTKLETEYTVVTYSVNKSTGLIESNP